MDEIKINSSVKFFTLTFMKNNYLFHFLMHVKICLNQFLKTIPKNIFLRGYWQWGYLVGKILMFHMGDFFPL